MTHAHSDHAFGSQVSSAEVLPARIKGEWGIALVGETITAALLAMVLFVITVQVVLLALHQPVSPKIVYVSLVVGAFVAIFPGHQIRLQTKWRFIQLAGTLSISIGALLLGNWLVDFSSDGQWYHQQAIIELLNGWNPLYAEAPASAGSAQIWIDSYAKGSWIFAASVARAFGTIEAGKALTFILAAGAFLMAFSAGVVLLALRMREALLVASLVALSPIVAYQFATYYLDAQVGSAFSIALTAGLLWVYSDNPQRFSIFLAALVVLSLLKFTGLVYAVLLFFSILVWRFVVKSHASKPKGFFFLLSVFGVCFLIGGFDPYATNIINHGTPFYPLMGEDSIDFIEANVSPEFAAQSRLSKLSASIMAESSGLSYNAAPGQWRVKYQLPFHVSKAEIATFYRYTDVRIGGLGPWFSAVLGLAIVTLLSGLFVLRSCSNFGALWLVLTIVLATVAVNPESWMMRYVPQLWLVPAIIGAVGLSCSHHRVRWVAKSLLLAMVINVALVAIPASAKVAVNQLDWRQQARVLRAAGDLSPVAVTAQYRASMKRLKQFGIRFHETSALPCEDPFRLVGDDAQVCLGELGLTPSDMESKLVTVLSALK